LHKTDRVVASTGTDAGSGRGGRLAAKLPTEQPTEGMYLPNLFPPPNFAETPHGRMADPGGRPPGPEPGFGNSSELQESLFWEGVWNERVAKALLGADSKNLKMRRLLPRSEPH